MYQPSASSLSLQRSVYTYYNAGLWTLSIDFMKFITLEHSFPISANWFDGFYDAEHTLHRNTHLSTLRFCGVFCTIANIRTLKRTVCTIQRFAASQKNRTEATTISPVSLSLLFSAKNRWFATLRCTKTDSTQPTLSAACFVVQSCLADADFVVFSNYCLIGTRHMFVRFFVDAPNS